MNEETSLPKMNTREVLKNYGKDELYKGFLFSTAMTGASLTVIYGLKKLASQYPVLKSLHHANKNLLGGSVALMYLIPQIINLKTYQRLSITDDLANFKVKDQSIESSAYTKYYFRPNPLKVLVKRLLAPNQKVDALNSLSEAISEKLSPSNLNELASYLLEITNNEEMKKKGENIVTAINAAIEKNIQLKITTLTEESTFHDWYTLYSLYQKLPSENKEKKINELKEKIEKFDKEKLVEIFLEVVENNKELKENFESLENFYNYDSLEDFCKFIAKLDETLEALFSEEYFNNKLNTLNENNKTKIEFIPVILTSLYLDEKNIDTRINALSEKLQNFSYPEIITFMKTFTSINNFLNEKVTTFNQKKILIQRLKFHFYLEFQIFCNHLESFKSDSRRFKMFEEITCSNVILSLHLLKELIDKDEFNRLLTICKEPLSTYIKNNELKKTLEEYFVENEKETLKEILDEA